MFNKILVPTDGAQRAHDAAVFVARLAQVHSATVVGVYVIDPFPHIGIGDASGAGLQAYMAEASAAAARALGDVQATCHTHNVPFVGDTIERNAISEGIIETAQAEGCDLIVMGSHGHRGVKALILGSVAQTVLTHAKVPVLVVKP